MAFQKKSANIDLLLDKGRRCNLIEEEAETQHNCELIKILLDVARTLARQGIAFRGSSLEKDENGNFRHIVNILARHSAILHRWLADAPKRPHRVDYLSSRSQNEFIELLAKYVSSRVIAEVCKAEMFAVIADTTPNVSHVDQLSVVARYVDQEGHAQEHLVDMQEIEDKTGEGHAQGILAALDENSISTANIVFQSYDYMSSMSGVFKGCQAKMKEHLGREVPYFPSHCVNTAVEHSCGSSTAACHMFEILQEVFVFFTSSPKRYSVFHEKVSGGDVENALDLTNLSARRWVARADYVR